MLISVYTPFYSSLCVTCRSVYLHIIIIYSVLHVDQCIYTVLSFTLCYIYIIYLERSILYSVLHIDQCIHTPLYFLLCYMYLCVSISFYSSLRVTCRSVYLHRSILHSVLHVDQCSYIVLFFTLCYM
jgi:hypothetical protein